MLAESILSNCYCKHITYFRKLDSNCEADRSTYKAVSLPPLMFLAFGLSLHFSKSSASRGLFLGCGAKGLPLQTVLPGEGRAAWQRATCGILGRESGVQSRHTPPDVHTWTTLFFRGRYIHQFVNRACVRVRFESAVWRRFHNYHVAGAHEIIFTLFDANYTAKWPVISRSGFVSE